MGTDALEFCRLTSEWRESLAHLFAVLRQRGEDEHFHPHPLTAEQASILAQYSGKDLYYVAVSGTAVAAYGMLRGWDEGYQVPSLGIAIHPDARGTGLASTFMQFLHAAARLRGATRVRLKVNSENTAARRLYQSLGYRFEDSDGGEIVGFVDL